MPHGPACFQGNCRSKRASPRFQLGAAGPIVSLRPVSAIDVAESSNEEVPEPLTSREPQGLGAPNFQIPDASKHIQFIDRPKNPPSHLQSSLRMNASSQTRDRKGRPTSSRESRPRHPRDKQQSFFRLNREHAYGGTLRRKKTRRGARPVSRRHALHMVFKSSQAKGPISFLHPRSRVILHRTLRQMALRYGLRIHEVGICGNHFHLLVRFHHRRFLLAFNKVFTGTLVKRLCGSAKLERRFFDFRPFTRVVESRRGYEVARDYVILNQLEGLGIIPYQRERTRSAWWRHHLRPEHPPPEPAGSFA